MENKNKKTKIYLIVIIVVLLFVVVLAVTRKANAPVVIQPQNNTDIGILGNSSDLVFLSVLPKAKVSGALDLTGEVKGGYFFEGNILVNILDANKNVLKQGHGTATTDWATADPVSFTAKIDFTGLPKGPAYLEIHNDNASGLPANDKSILVPIVITASGTSAIPVSDAVTTKPQTFMLISLDNNKTVTITKGDTVSITLSNPGDGGYTFNEPEFSSTIYKLESHVHDQPSSAMPGNFGTDTWKFISVGTGTSTINITASRPWEKVAPTSIFTVDTIVK